MELSCVYDILRYRDKLCDKYAGLIGRNAFYEEHRPLIIEGLILIEEGAELHTKRLSEIATKLLKARAAEAASHLQRVRTEGGDAIHNTEYELYSFAFDVFQSAAEAK